MPTDTQHPVRRGVSKLVGGVRRYLQRRREKAEGRFDAKPYFWAAWEVVKRDFSLLAFKIAADLVRSVAVVGVLIFIFVFLAGQVGLALEAEAGPLAGLIEFAERLQTPQFIIGAVGLIVVASVVGFTTEVTALSGIWGTFGDATRERPVRFVRSFFSGVSRHFPAALGLRVITVVGQATVLLTGLSILVALFAASTGTTWLTDQPAIVRGLFFAAPLTVLSALALFVRLTLEIAAAPLIIDGRGLGASLLEAAHLVTRRFEPIYRLLLVAATLILAPLLLYWGLVMVQNIGMVVPELAPILGLMRLVGDVLMFAAMSVISVLFYGALFFYFADERGSIDRLPGRT
ncbi:MAG: hypothetical protein ACOCV2_12590 [Persicimonas sp.]